MTSQKIVQWNSEIKSKTRKIQTTPSLLPPKAQAADRCLGLCGSSSTIIRLLSAALAGLIWIPILSAGEQKDSLDKSDAFLAKYGDQHTLHAISAGSVSVAISTKAKRNEIRAVIAKLPLAGPAEEKALVQIVRSIIKTTGRRIAIASLTVAVGAQLWAIERTTEKIELQLMEVKENESKLSEAENKSDSTNSPRNRPDAAATKEPH